MSCVTALRIGEQEFATGRFGSCCRVGMKVPPWRRLPGQRCACRPWSAGDR